jgi:hypothetical protein
MGNVGMIAGGAALAGVAALGAAIVGGAQDAQASRAVVWRRLRIPLSRILGDSTGCHRATGGRSLIERCRTLPVKVSLATITIQGAENVHAPVQRFKEIKVPLDRM